MLFNELMWNKMLKIIEVTKISFNTSEFGSSIKKLYKFMAEILIEAGCKLCMTCWYKIKQS